MNGPTSITSVSENPALSPVSRHGTVENVPAIAILIVVALGVILTVLTLLAAGWVYSAGLRERALRIRGPSRNYGVWVRSVGAASITLEAAGPRQDIGHPGTLGVFWESGYGRTGDLTGIDGPRITRAFEMVRGEGPPLCPDGPLQACSPVDLESYAYPSDPSDVGLGYEEILYQSSLGSMGGWVVPAVERGRWAIHVHGWSAERREAIRLLPPLHEEGFTSMVIDYRNDPGAPSDPSGHYRFGLTEWEDVEGAVRHAFGQGARDLLLIGYSTGAAHVMSFLERSDLADRVTGVLLDSPNIILAEAIRANSRDVHYPLIGLRVGRLATEFGMWIADLRWKIDWETTNYVQRADEILTAPALVFHGTSDHRVPISVSRQLEARAPEEVTLVETPAAGHVMSWNADPERYERYLRMFLSSL